MVKIKETENRDISETPQEEPVFPESYVMNEWSHNPHSRDAEMHLDRSRETLDMVGENESDYHIPREWWPDGFQLGFMTEYVLGQPQPDNLRKRQRQGWQFVHEDEIPQLKMQLMNHEFDKNRNDGWIRMGGHILMKKPEENYLRQQEARRQMGEEVRRQSEATTDFLGGGKDPRYILENKQSYQPAHRMGKR